MISIVGGASDVGSVATGARRFCVDGLDSVGVGLEPLEVEFLIVVPVGVTSTAHGLTLISDLRGSKGYELASKGFINNKLRSITSTDFAKLKPYCKKTVHCRSRFIL